MLAIFAAYSSSDCAPIFCNKYSPVDAISDNKFAGAFAKPVKKLAFHQSFLKMMVRRQYKGLVLEYLLAVADL